jgi:hypothetical protein
LRLGEVEFRVESTEVTIAIPKINPTLPASPVRTPGEPAACHFHRAMPATHRCTRCHQVLCDNCVISARRRRGVAPKLCPLCRHACELICPQHPDTAATHRCLHCGRVLCMTCVRRLKREEGNWFTLCPFCNRECHPICARHPDAAVTYRCTRCELSMCDLCARRSRQSGKDERVCVVCRGPCAPVCNEHPEARADFRCPKCATALCAGCVQKARTGHGQARRFCSKCGHLCEPIGATPEPRKTQALTLLRRVAGFPFSRRQPKR